MSFYADSESGYKYYLWAANIIKEYNYITYDYDGNLIEASTYGKGGSEK